MIVPQVIIDLLEWQGRPWWQRFWLRLTGQGFQADHSDGQGFEGGVGVDRPEAPLSSRQAAPSSGDRIDGSQREPGD